MAKHQMPYHEESKDEFGHRAAETWTFVYEPKDNPDLIRLNGKCPVCQHDVDYPYPLGLVRDTVFVEAKAPTIHIPVICRCDTAHPKSHGEIGCGRSWKLEVPRP